MIKSFWYESKEFQRAIRSYAGELICADKEALNSCANSWQHKTMGPALSWPRPLDAYNCLYYSEIMYHQVTITWRGMKSI